MPKISMEQIVSLAKRRGFIFQHDELYGGLGSVWDYGPYGALMKENIKRAFVRRFVQERDDIVLLDSAVLTMPAVLEASGHVQNFHDPLVECKICHQRFRADQDIPKVKDHEHELTEEKQFNLMFKTALGPIENSKDFAYLRPETAQGMFTQFANVLEATRRKLPLGIAQVGKSFRNEITTGNFTFRSREFEIVEIEYFVPSTSSGQAPSTDSTNSQQASSGQVGSDDEWFVKWVGEWEQFVYSLGIKEGTLHHYDHPKESLAHYSKATTDLLYDFPFGKEELAGIANRTDFDLQAHQKASGQSLEVFDSETNEKYIPFVIEPTIGIDRLFLALLCDAIEVFPQGRKNFQMQNSNLPTPLMQQGASKNQHARQAPLAGACGNDYLIIKDENQDKQQEIVLHLDPQIAPIQVAVLPLSKKTELTEPAKKIAQDLRQKSASWRMVEYDETGSIGKRYRRQDEIGTPLCVTYDFESATDQKVTVRHRDTMEQDRISIDEIDDFIQKELENW